MYLKCFVFLIANINFIKKLTFFLVVLIRIKDFFVEGNGTPILIIVFRFI